MTQETEQNINEAINWLQQTGTSIQDFALEQAPLYCQELITWEVVGGTAFAVFGLLLITAGALSARWGLKQPLCRYECMKEAAVVAVAAGGIAIAAGIPITTSNALDVTKAKTAPRVVIMEHLRGLK